MSKKETSKPETGEDDPDAMSPWAKVAAVLLLLLFAVYLIFYSDLRM